MSMPAFISEGRALYLVCGPLPHEHVRRNEAFHAVARGGGVVVRSLLNL